MESLKADFHIHSSYSMDCEMSPKKIISRCLETGINCIAITDHGSIEGALEIKRLAPFPVIIGEEILTPDGEIMGLFLKETIPSGISVEQAIASIKAQGGLVCLPHPFDTFRGIRLDRQRLEELGPQLDLIELFNARSPFLRAASKARTFARKHDLPGTAGSDSHTPGEIGSTYVVMAEFDGQESFIRALKTARIHRRRGNPLAHLNSTWVKLKRHF